MRLLWVASLFGRTFDVEVRCIPTHPTDDSGMVGAGSSVDSAYPTAEDDPPGLGFTGQHSAG